MRILLHFIFLLTLPNVTLIAQGAILRGTVRLQNSGNLPVENFEVTASGAEAPVMTLKNGDFKLKFPKKSPGSRVFIKLIEDKYIWTNKSQYESFYLPSNPDENEIVLEICDRKEYERNLKAKEEAIARDVKKKLDKLDNNDIATDVKLDSILKKINSFSQDVKNTEEYKKLLTEKEQILLEKQKIEAERERLELMMLKKEENAKKLAEFNVDNASPLSQKALDAINDGSLDQALEILNLDTLNRNLSSIKMNKDKIDKFKSEIDSVFDKAVQDYMVAAYIATASYRFEDAEKYYKRAIEADTSNEGNILIYAIHELMFSQNEKSMLRAAELTKDLITKANLFLIYGYARLVKINFNSKDSEYQEYVNLADKGFFLIKQLYDREPNDYELEYLNVVAFRCLYLLAFGKHKEIRDLVSKLITKIEKSYKEDNKRIGLGLSRLHGILGVIGMTEPSIKHKKEIENNFLRSIALAKSALNDDNILDVANDVNLQYKNLISAYENILKDTLKAEQCQRELLSFLLPLYQKDSVLLRKNIAHAYNSWGNFLFRCNKDGSKKILEAIELYELLQDDEQEGVKSELANCYGVLVDKYFFKNILDSAEFFIKKSLHLEEFIDKRNTQFNKLGLGPILPNISMGKNNEGIKTLEMSIETEDGKIQSSKENIAKFYSMLAYIKFNQDSCLAVKEYQKKTLGIFKNMDSTTSEKSRYYIALSFFYNTNCNWRSGLLSPRETINDYTNCMKLLTPFFYKDSFQIDELICSISINLGAVYWTIQRFDSAESSYKLAYDLFKKHEEMQQNGLNYDILLTNLVDFYIEKNNYSALHNILNDKEALYKKTSQGRTLDSLLAEVYYKMGLYALFEKNYQLSEQYYTFAISKMQELQKNNSNYAFGVASCQNDLGVIYANTRRFELAEEFFKRALFHREMLSITDANVNKYVAQTASNLADLYIQQGSKWPFFARKANKLAKKNKIILANIEMENNLKEEYLQAIQSIESRASTYILQELKEMEPLLSQIDTLREQEKDPRTNQKKIKDFEKIYNLTSEGLTKYPEHDSLYYLQAEACTNLSWYYVLNKEYRKAEEKAKKALLLNINGFEWVETNLALAYLLQNNWDACVEIYDRRSSEYYDQNRKWKDVFLGDLQILKENSIEHPNIEKAINYLVNRP